MTLDTGVCVSCWQVLSELASPECITLQTCGGLLEAVSHCAAWVGGIADGPCWWGSRAQACTSLQHVLTSIHGLRSWGVFRHVQKEQVLLERGKQISWSAGRWRVHSRRRNDSQRTSEIRQERLQRTYPETITAASSAKRLLKRSKKTNHG